MADVTIRKGTRIPPEETRKLDRSKMGVMTSQPPKSEVEGQAVYWGATQCPYCAHVGWAELDTGVYTWFTCGACGAAFRA